ncbi:threonylcarbamoyladenosine tRNA methylthiotransferase-like [Oncorhynchus kisutch]|uniref:threonylcarbamoyladenosine tRNA methylthiotransferase-like n=1 Tax=Oncorhynchus kisutch TaxID=8019 RepID=UPI0012DE9FF4|nr:threonylcarbamoyladenosine tRNA methylthiotransferase-like [Oncorhynchus kisutch]
MIEVEIFEAGKHFLKGRPLDGSVVFTPSIAEPLQQGEVSGLSQEQLSLQQNGSVPSSGVLTVSWSLDREGLKLLSISLAVVAILVVFMWEKLH